MNPLFEAAWEISDFLRQQNLSYAIIGGLAVQKWGDVRFTNDVDLTVVASVEENSSELVHLITTYFHSRINRPEEFARRNRMILITASNGIDIDISLGLPGYEDEMVSNAVDYEIEADKTIRLCSAEDLIIHKAIAGRPQDVTDIQGIVYRQGEKLDFVYIRDWLKQFAELLDDPEIQNRFEAAWKKHSEE